MGALSSVLEKENEQNNMMLYLSSVTCSIGRVFCGNSLPYFTELISEQAPIQDTRSGKEILEDIKSKLRRSIMNRGEKK